RRGAGWGRRWWSWCWRWWSWSCWSRWWWWWSSSSSSSWWSWCSLWSSWWSSSRGGRRSAARRPGSRTAGTPAPGGRRRASERDALDVHFAFGDRAADGGDLDGDLLPRRHRRQVDGGGGRAAGVAGQRRRLDRAQQVGGARVVAGVLVLAHLDGERRARVRLALDARDQRGDRVQAKHPLVGGRQRRRAQVEQQSAEPARLPRNAARERLPRRPGARAVEEAGAGVQLVDRALQRH